MIKHVCKVNRKLLLLWTEIFQSQTLSVSGDDWGYGVSLSGKKEQKLKKKKKRTQVGTKSSCELWQVCKLTGAGLVYSQGWWALLQGHAAHCSSTAQKQEVNQLSA